MAESDKIMFEIYREEGYAGLFRVVYFTELDEHNKEREIARAMAGEHVFDGFIPQHRADQAKQAIDKLLDQLNDGEAKDENQIEEALSAFLTD